MQDTVKAHDHNSGNRVNSSRDGPAAPRFPAAAFHRRLAKSFNIRCSAACAPVPMSALHHPFQPSNLPLSPPVVQTVTQSCQRCSSTLGKLLYTTSKQLIGPAKAHQMAISFSPESNFSLILKPPRHCPLNTSHCSTRSLPQSCLSATAIIRWRASVPWG